jgi:hypothetical protein
VRSVVLALVVLAVAAPAAEAAPAITFKLAGADVQFGHPHSVSGVLADGTTPLAGQTVVLEGQRRFVGAWLRLAGTVTDAQGAYGFKPTLDRNYRLRAVVPALGISSEIVRAYTFPAFALTFQALKPGFVRLIQRYTVPRDVRLIAPTTFYLGPPKAKVSTLSVKAKTRRLRAGRYRARATVALPAAWNGRFRFASCFHTSRGSGMGKPDARCPKRFRFQ